MANRVCCFPMAPVWQLLPATQQLTERLTERLVPQELTHVFLAAQTLKDNDIAVQIALTPGNARVSSGGKAMVFPAGRTGSMAN